MVFRAYARGLGFEVGSGGRYDTLLARFGLDDAALRKVGELVHDVDCKDGKFGRPEAAGLAALIQGIEAGHAGDAERIAEGERIFEGLYAYYGARSD